jgi:hypothetical protein
MKQAAAANFVFIEPMKALVVRDLPAGDWLYEMKFDGYRALAFKAGKEVRLISRNRTNFDNDYPPLIDALKLLRAKQAIIDGEIAALDDEGKSSFQLLQSCGKGAEEIRESFLKEYHMANIKAHASRNLLASLWWLERKFPREYALRTVNRPDPHQENEPEPEIPAEVLARHRRLYLEAAREDEAASCLALDRPPAPRALSLSRTCTPNPAAKLGNCLSAGNNASGLVRSRFLHTVRAFIPTVAKTGVCRFPQKPSSNRLIHEADENSG